MMWQLIETAPSDTEIIATDGDSVFCGVMKQFRIHVGIRFHYLDQSKDYGAPTHWMPLPPPPKPTRTASEWSAWFTSKADGTTKLDLTTCAEVERVSLGDGKQFAYRVKKWVE